MVFVREVARLRAEKAYEQEDRTNQHVEAVEACRHIERGRVNAFPETKRCVGIFISLECGEKRTQDDSPCQALDEIFAVAVQQGVMRPGDSAA